MSPRALVVTAVAAACAAAALSGCVSLPTNGPVNKTGLSSSTGPDQLVQLMPRPPGAGWTTKEIVTGFLAATGSSLSGSSSPGSDPLAVAKEYLAPRSRAYWRPALLSPTVIDSSLADLAITSHTVPPRLNAGPAAAVVQVTSNHVERLRSNGNIVVSLKRQVFEFSLFQSSAGQWRIETLPTRALLLLTRPDFERDYQPRNLYFFAGSSPSQVLVPYPVFIPEQAETQAEDSVWAKDLLLGGQAGAGPPGWLNQATSTAFPPDAQITSVDVTGIKAVVNLDLPASGRLSDERLSQMAAQLVWTLTESPYRGGFPGIGLVQLVVRHGPSELLVPQMFTSWVPAVRSGQLYAQSLNLTGRPVLSAVSLTGSASKPVPLPAELGTGLFGLIAVSPSGSGPTVLAGCRGKSAYLAPLSARSRPVTQVLPADCTSLSWDGGGNLWAVAGGDVYVLPAIRHGVLVRLPRIKVLSGLNLPGLLSFRLAPDGVRAAMIVQSKAGNKLFIAAISSNAGYVYLAQVGKDVQVGSDVPNPIALSWQNPDNLVVLGLPAGAPQRYLYQVPLNGEPSTQSIFPAPSGARWLAVSGQGVVVGALGRQHGLIWQTRTWNGPWLLSRGYGSTPVYPG